MTEQLAANFEADIDRFNKSIGQRMETKVSKLNFIINYLREETGVILITLILKSIRHIERIRGR
jgi:uncharacterized protein (UPF0210 family)